MSITVLLPQAVLPAAGATERSLYLYYTHTRETARIVFKRNGQYVQSGLNELNQFLRDWRRNEPAKMDPRLFDLVWEVYEEVGGSQPINIVSAYRSPATNAMLAANSSGVADNSQHMRGTAMDFFIPGVSLSKLRAVAMKKQVGGVGYYPTSGSPFVHLDTGNVRAWPRMTRAQLQDVFPDGRTLHVPTDGRPLSQEGYRLAQAEWQRCHAVPCDGGSSGTRVASAEGSGRSLLDMFFGGEEAQPRAEAAAANVQLASIAPPTSRPVAPTPMLRPASLGGIAAAAAVAGEPAIPFSTTGSAPLDAAEVLPTRTAPVPAMKSQALLVATAAARTPAETGETAVTALAALTQPFPRPRLHMSEPEPELVAAYAPATPQDPDAQRALQMIIQSDATTTASVAPPTAQPRLAVAGLRPAALGTDPVTDAMAGLFASTFGAVQPQQASAPVAAALAEMVAGRTAAATPMRNSDLIAPDLEHIAEIFVDPALLSSDHFASITEHDEADFNPATEMGRFVTVMGVGDVPDELSHTRFTTKPLVLASR